MKPLPDLPKKIKKQEADFGLEFRKWWNKKRMRGTFELKDSKGKNSIPFSCVDDDQVTIAKLGSSEKGVLVRVSVGTPGTADYIGLVKDPAFIVIHYPKIFHVIPINNFLFEKERSKRKSLTADRAKEISTISVKL